ncbi:MAG: dihydroorotate dehydrogenase electron transfer subunit [Treponema sp.]|nr:dihydroorotate dehydrogenase electron transfer subunit [Treponema sp.]
MLNDEIAVLEFFWPGHVPGSGQFFLVRPLTSSVFLGRPLGAAGFLPGGFGGPGVVRFLLAVRGTGTQELAAIRPGEKAFLTGPLGRGWNEVSAEAGFGLARHGAVALVSGGTGIAPLGFLAAELQSAGILSAEPQSAGLQFDFYAGFKSKAFGFQDLKPRKLVITSEHVPNGYDAFEGYDISAGLVTDHFSPDSYDAVYACGPEPMIKAAADKCLKAGVPCFVSMERRMACGAGACLGCTVRTKAGNRRCCADGPVFNAEDIIFE